MAATPAAVRGGDGVRPALAGSCGVRNIECSRAGVGSHCATLPTRGSSLGALLKLDLAHLPLALTKYGPWLLRALDRQLTGLEWSAVGVLANPLARADGACPADAGGSKSERESERESESVREEGKSAHHSTPSIPLPDIPLCALPPPPSSIQPTGALLLLSGHSQPLERLM